MNVQSFTNNNIKIVRISGEVNFENYNKFRDDLLKHITGERPKILLDMEELSYLNSMGLSAILKAYSKAKKEKGELRLCRLQSHIKKLFSITKLNEVIIIYDGLEEAIKEFTKK
ncbi:MAG: hypothetical protein PWQ37_527 [Candidatus Petromonas sp.]|jgi:anti-anti-sigma factor|nr:hypothetical protein [Candidatus Petromonas sp.]